MRKISTILLLLLFTAQTELGQLLKTPVMVQHYITHQQANGSLSLLDFLQEHYQPGHQDGDIAADNELPFKSYNSQLLFQLYVPGAAMEAVGPRAKTFTIPFAELASRPLCQKSFAVFHPPRILLFT